MSTLFRKFVKVCHHLYLFSIHQRYFCDFISSMPVYCTTLCRVNLQLLIFSVSQKPMKGSIGLANKISHLFLDGRGLEGRQEIKPVKNPLPALPNPLQRGGVIKIGSSEFYRIGGSSRFLSAFPAKASNPHLNF